MADDLNIPPQRETWTKKTPGGTYNHRKKTTNENENVSFKTDQTESGPICEYGCTSISYSTCKKNGNNCAPLT